MTYTCPRCKNEPEIIGDDYFHCIDCCKGEIEDLLVNGKDQLDE